jgi:hypothetical protein
VTLTQRRFRKSADFALRAGSTCEAAAEFPADISQPPAAVVDPNDRPNQRSGIVGDHEDRSDGAQARDDRLGRAGRSGTGATHYGGNGTITTLATWDSIRSGSIQSDPRKLVDVQTRGVAERSTRDDRSRRHVLTRRRYPITGRFWGRSISTRRSAQGSTRTRDVPTASFAD